MCIPKSSTYSAHVHTQQVIENKAKRKSQVSMGEVQMNFRQSGDCTASTAVGPYFCRAISFCWYSSFRISTFCLRVWHSSSSPALAVCSELRSSSNFLIWSIRNTKVSSVCVQRPQRQDWGGSSEKWDAWTFEPIYLFSQILNCSNAWQF